MSTIHFILQIVESTYHWEYRVVFYYLLYLSLTKSTYIKHIGWICVTLITLSVLLLLAILSVLTDLPTSRIDLSPVLDCTDLPIIHIR